MCYLCLLYARHLQQPRNGDGGLMPQAQNVENEVDCFLLFMNVGILQKIEHYTNRNIDGMIQAMNQTQREYVRTKGTWIKITSSQELKAFFGLMVLRGAYQWNYKEVAKFWDEVPMFSATMTMKRFYFLNQMICFDDRDTRADRWTRDRGAAMREIFEEWNDTLSQAVYIGKVCSFL